MDNTTSQQLQELLDISSTLKQHSEQQNHEITAIKESLQTSEQKYKTLHELILRVDKKVTLLIQESRRSTATKTAPPPRPIATKTTAAQKKKQAMNKMSSYLSKKNTIYDVDLLNCFISSTQSVLEIYVKEKPEFLNPNLDLTNYKTPFLSGKMSLKGTTTGHGAIAVSFSQESIYKLSAEMVGMKSVDQVSEELAADFAKELCNQVCGQAKIQLTAKNYKFELEIPELLRGADRQSSENKAPNIILNFRFFKEYICQLEFWD